MKKKEIGTIQLTGQGLAMAGMLTEDTDLEAISTDQRCQSGESLAEWSRSSEQVENGTPSTSPPYYDTDDEDCGLFSTLLFSVCLT